MSSKQTDKYESRRNLDKTSEPESSGDAKKNGDHPVFVIQKHDASSLHYDFRLEIDGVLKSWAIPKGPSTDPSEKRMAIPTEDHPLDYADYEGVIPEGEYGAGPVLVWDKGPYENIKELDGELVPMDECLKNGQIEVRLSGQKLQGGYALVEMTSGIMEGNWLFIKMDDDKADARRNPVNTEPKSVKSGRTLDEIEGSDSEE